MSLKIGIFVDIHNQVEALASTKQGRRINYEKYLEYIAAINGDLLWKKNAYGIYLTDDGISFIQVLTNLGYKPVFYKTRTPEDCPNRCLEIALDIIDSISKLDIVVLGTNSPDFIPLIHWLQTKSIRVWQISPNLNHLLADVNIDLLKESTTILESINTLKGKENGSGQRSAEDA